MNRLTALTLDQCLKPPSRGGLSADDVKELAQSLGIGVAKKTKAVLCAEIISKRGKSPRSSPAKAMANRNKGVSPSKKAALGTNSGMLAVPTAVAAVAAPSLRRTPKIAIANRHRFPYGPGTGRIQTALSIAPEKTRDEVIALAAGVQKGDSAAIAEAQELARAYFLRKEKINELFETWRQAGFHAGDDELLLAGEFLGRYCRCLQRMANKPVMSKFGTCGKSVFHTSDPKGLVAPTFQGAGAVKCDDALAMAEIAIEGTLKQK